MAEGRRGPVVLTPDGEFLELPGLDGVVGEEIAFAPSVRRTAARRRLLFSASAAAFLLLIAVGLARLPVFGGPQIAAYVAIDINPSVEIGVDRKLDVVELHALNPEGARVIEGVAYRKRPVGEVAAEIIRNAEAAEYLRDGGEVFVTSMAADGVGERFEEELVREIDRAVHAAALHPGGEPEDGEGAAASSGGAGPDSGKEGLEDAGKDRGADGAKAIPGAGSGSGGTAAHPGAGPDGTRAQSGSNAGTAKPGPAAGGAAPKREPASSSGRDIAVTIVRAPGELRETAKANGVSPGKMAVYLLAEKRGLPIKLDDLKQGSIRQAVEPYGGLAGLLGDGNSGEDRKRELAELLAKEAAAKARDKAADASGGKKAAGGKEPSGGKKAAADGGKDKTAVAKKTAADGGKDRTGAAGRKPAADDGKRAPSDNGRKAPAVDGKNASAATGRKAGANGSKNASWTAGKKSATEDGKKPSPDKGKKTSADDGPRFWKAPGGRLTPVPAGKVSAADGKAPAGAGGRDDREPRRSLTEPGPVQRREVHDRRDRREEEPRKNGGQDRMWQVPGSPQDWMRRVPDLSRNDAGRREQASQRRSAGRETEIAHASIRPPLDRQERIRKQPQGQRQDPRQDRLQETEKRDRQVRGQEAPARWQERKR
ncbi:MAG: hypothetical protein A9Z00_08345 [Thermobacillus sp. ZCTH02-B1]|nr:MAG: hypothetical protein A9Z00_08345 [Thermobacillus sp. ZCTH02-B1]